METAGHQSIEPPQEPKPSTDQTGLNPPPETIPGTRVPLFIREKRLFPFTAWLDMTYTSVFLLELVGPALIALFDPSPSPSLSQFQFQSPSGFIVIMGFSFIIFAGGWISILLYSLQQFRKSTVSFGEFGVKLVISLIFRTCILLLLCLIGTFFGFSIYSSMYMQ